jgi:hypothetical protein
MLLKVLRNIKRDSLHISPNSQSPMRHFTQANLEYKLSWRRGKSTDKRRLSVYWWLLLTVFLLTRRFFFPTMSMTQKENALKILRNHHDHRIIFFIQNLKKWKPQNSIVNEKIAFRQVYNINNLFFIVICWLSWRLNSLNLCIRIFLKVQVNEYKTEMFDRGGGGEHRHLSLL